MSMLADLLLKHLVPAIAEWLFAGLASRGFGPAGGLAASGLSDAIRARFPDRQQAKDAGQSLADRAAAIVEDLAADIVKDLAQLLEGEGLAPPELERPAEELRRLLLTEDVLRLALEADLNAAKLEAALLAAPPPASIWPGEERPQQLYGRLVRALAARLPAVVRALPHYETGRDQAFLERLSHLRQRIDAILAAGLEAASAAAAAAAHAAATRALVEDEQRRLEATRHRDEQAYRNALLNQVRLLRPFGLDQDPSLAPDLPLEVAYVPLRLELAGLARGLRLAFPEVLALLPALGNRLLIEAPAGFGKTTLLQWLTRTSLDAVGRFPDAAAVLDRLDDSCRGPRHGPKRRLSNEEEALLVSLRRLRAALSAGAVPWHERLPAFLRLRDLRDDDLWPVADWPKRIASQASIETLEWWTAALREGRAILLLDGVDEVPPARRNRLREAIEALIAAHPHAMVVVTSRPGAVADPRWMRLFDNARLSIEPMGPSEIENFVGHWHAALRQIAPGRAPSEDKEHRLLRRLLDWPGLRNLAQVPLLCAAICWLARIRRGELPDRMPDLFEKLVDQLVHRLDAERLGRDGLARLVPVLEGLDSTDRISLLARLAWFAVRERRDARPRTGEPTDQRRPARSRQGGRHRVRAQRAARLSRCPSLRRRGSGGRPDPCGARARRVGHSRPRRGQGNTRIPGQADPRPSRPGSPIRCRHRPAAAHDGAALCRDRRARIRAAREELRALEPGL